jgi:N-terminal domain of reverse transcriptase
MANGPEGLLPALTADGWDSIDWQRHEQEVRRLRSRIFKAVQEGDWPKVRNLQKLMLRSWSNTLVSVRQVTQRNTGRKTAGIDGEVALTSLARAELATTLHESSKPWRAWPVKRVWIVRRGGALSYPQRSWEELGGSFLGLMANPKSKGGRDSSMSEKSRPWEGIEGVRDGTRVIWQRLDCLKSNLRSVKTRTRRKDACDRCRTMRRHGM